LYIIHRTGPFGNELKIKATILGTPSITSGNQKCIGAIDDLNRRPKVINDNGIQVKIHNELSVVK